jgi:hypothetical protein
MAGKPVSIWAFVEPFELEEEEEEETGLERRKVARRDQFGFELNTEYSEKHIRHALRTSTRQEELDDRACWDALLGIPGWKDDMLTPIRMKRLIKKFGVPSEHRQRVWWFITGQAKVLQAHPEVFSTLLRQQRGDNINDFHEQIEKDLRRTFPGHALFDSENGIGRLRRVLLAYSCHNSVLGYCQSMNYLAAFLLLVFEEERAFWMLVHLLDSVVPPDFHGEHMFGAVLEQDVFAYLIKQKLPRLHEHSLLLGHPLATTTSQWFLCLFVGILTAEVTFKIWDNIFRPEGGYALFVRVALALLKLSEAELLAAKDCIEMFSIVREIPKYHFDAALLLHEAKKFSSVQQKRLVELRERFRPAACARMEENRRKRQEAYQRRQRLCAQRKLSEKKVSVPPPSRDPSPVWGSLRSSNPRSLQTVTIGNVRELKDEPVQ